MLKPNEGNKKKSNELILEEVKLDGINVLEETNIPAMGVICGYGCWGAACGAGC